MPFWQRRTMPPRLRKLPTVGDCMDHKVHTVTTKTDIRVAIGGLLKHHVTGAPVVDEVGRVVGMLTERDCLRLITLGADGEIPSGTVAEFMTTELTTVPPDMDIYFAAGLFLNHHFRRLPVVEDGKLVGAITRFDLLRAIQAYLY